MKKLLISLLFFVTYVVVNAQKLKNQIKVGWCVYSFEAYSKLNLELIEKHKPTIIRLFMEWDRHDIMKNGNSMRKFHIEKYKPFFESCARNQIILVVQMWVKDRLWNGDGDGGASWAKPDKFTNYPSNIEQSYGTFVRDLVNFMNACGIKNSNIIMEAWNEPDLLWGVSNTSVNYHEPWKIFSKKGFSKWSGGSGEKWQALHKVLDKTHPDIQWANSSVANLQPYTSWITPTYQIPQVKVLDIHYYLWNTKTAQEYCDSVSKVIQRWDALLPSGKNPYPFFLGEFARFSSGNTEKLIISKEDAKIMRQACELLHKKYGKRFLGAIAHGPIQMWENGFIWFE